MAIAIKWIANPVPLKKKSTWERKRNIHFRFSKSCMIWDLRRFLTDDHPCCTMYACRALNDFFILYLHVPPKHLVPVFVSSPKVYPRSLSSSSSRRDLLLVLRLRGAICWILLVLPPGDGRLHVATVARFGCCFKEINMIPGPSPGFRPEASFRRRLKKAPHCTFPSLLSMSSSSLVCNGWQRSLRWYRGEPPSKDRVILQCWHLQLLAQVSATLPRLQ